MLWRWLCVVVALLHLSVGSAQSANLSGDPLLQRRITVWLKMEPLREALQQVGRKTGISLRCQDAIAGEKVAIFVEDRPAHEILIQLAKLFRYEWRKHEDGGYILYIPDETRLQEEKLANAAREVRHRALRELVRAAREIRQLSLEQRGKEWNALWEKRDSLTPEQETRLSVLYGMTPTRPMRRTPEDEWVETDELFFSDQYTLYHCLASLPDRAVDALINGHTIGLSTKPVPGVFALGRDALLPNWMRDRKWFEKETASEESSDRFTEQTAPYNPEFAGVWLRVGSRLNMIEYQLVSLSASEFTYDGQSNTSRSLTRHEYALAFNVVPYLSDQPLWRFWTAWAMSEEQLLEAFPERVPPRNDRPAPRSPEYVSSDAVRSPQVTTVDVLEQIAWVTRRPVISDAFRFRRLYGESAYQTAPRPALARLTRFCWLRVDESGYLLVRHQHYWALRKYELSEALLRPLEQKYEQQGWLTLDDYVALAGKLTEAQVEFLIQGRHFFMHPLTRFEFEPLIACLPALRFLASLNAAQRQQLASGQWLLRRRLNPTQQRRFNEALGDQFPPAQQLFSEPLPEDTLDATEELLNLYYTQWGYEYFGVSEDSDSQFANMPQEPAVRLFIVPEERRPFIQTAHGYISSSFHGEIDKDLYEIIQNVLQREPGSRLMAARLRRVQIEFTTERGEWKKYNFVLWRSEPYVLPEPKPEKGEAERSKP
ncbi:MAG: hypothetical protein N2651_10365 [Fimbriimonadales bacterium]|nr:hypothetical protein [Fimbriimonadales bacterium]